MNTFVGQAPPDEMCVPIGFAARSCRQFPIRPEIAAPSEQRHGFRQAQPDLQGFRIPAYQAGVSAALPEIP